MSPPDERSGAPPLVTVVTIFLDAERFLAEAIESVRAQTYPAWELVLVDDGSTDGSTAIARGYAERHPDRIRYLEHAGHANLGMSASRNAGIRAARGALIALLDGDDVYRPEKLERQVAALSGHPEVGCVYGATEYWYSWTGRRRDATRDRVRRRGLEPDTVVHPPALLARFLRDEARTPTTCGVLMRREAVERAGGFEERFRGMFEDQVFFYKLCATTSVYVDPGCWDRYRQHPASTSHRALARGEWTRHHSAAPSRLAFYEWLDGFLDAQGIDDPELRAIVARERAAGGAPPPEPRGLAARVRAWLGRATLGGR